MRMLSTSRAHILFEPGACMPAHVKSRCMSAIAAQVQVQVRHVESCHARGPACTWRSLLLPQCAIIPPGRSIQPPMCLQLTRLLLPPSSCHPARACSTSIPLTNRAAGYAAAQVPRHPERRSTAAFTFFLGAILLCAPYTRAAGPRVCAATQAE